MRNFFKALIVLMGITASHVLSATTPDDPAYEIQVKHWNSAHAVTLNAVGSEISGAFGNGGGVSFALETDGKITAAGPAYQPIGNYLTTARASNDAVGLNTAKTNVTWTVNSSGLSLDAGGYAGTGFTSVSTAGVDIKATQNTAGLSMGVPAYLTTYVGQTVQTQASGNIPRSGFTTTSVAGDQVAGTHDTAGLKLAVPAYLTTAQAVGNYLTTARASNDAIGLNTAKTNVTWTVNSSGLSLDAGGYAGTTSGFAGENISGSMTHDTAGLKLSLSVAGPGAGATYSNYFAPFPWDENSATSTLSLSNLGVQPFTLAVNLSFGQVNFIGSASVAPTSASNNFSARLTNSTQACSYTAGFSITNSNMVDLYFFSRGTGSFSTELESVFSTRNSWVTYLNATHSGSVTLTNTAGGSVKVSQAISMSISYPMITSGQVINGATSHTTWGTGYTTWTSTANNNSLDTISTSAAKAIALASTYPGTTAWTSNKMVLFNLGSTLSPGEWYIGMVRYSSTSSSSNSSGAFTGAAGTGNSFSTTYAGSNLTQTGQLTFGGQTATIVSSLGWLGFASQNSMAPSPGLGSFSGTYTGTGAYLANAGNPAGAIALSDVRTQVSFFSSWFQLASNRI